MLLLGTDVPTTAKLPPAGSFFLDKKGTKKSRPNRNLSEHPQKLRKKNIFLRNFFGRSETTIF